jgi:DMSO/TMAO reductase YedYZ heme-binding membrane subunit
MRLDAAALGPSAYWYLTRSTGAVALLLLTFSVVLGILGSIRFSVAPRWPRFAIDALHRDTSLLVIVLVALHVVTSVLDGFAPLSLIDGVIPFRSSYRPLWLGLGTLSFDLLIALVVTSLLRHRLGYRTWRQIHWLAYACWPIAVVHGLGTGSDTKSAWMLLVTAACTAAVVAAVWARALSGWLEHRGVSLSAFGAAVFVPLALVVWLPIGPLGSDWARRAGTPASLLRSTGAGGSTSSGSGSGTSSGSGSSQSGGSGGVSAFTAQGSGTVQQSQTPSGLGQVEIQLTLQGTSLSALDIKIVGQPEAGGGLSMTSSDVSLGPPSDPTRYRGAITSLQGTNLAASLSSGSGHSLTLNAQLQLDPSGGTTATGTVSVQPGS